ncbi:hypothetical protein ACG04Q_17320 [Roseateles sp. DXS20W]|uniref:Uncharacterized protein n=1 Tax=Pelomonas lactea TaxID=3299030 RepID=A0ABW7GNC3_9BURK
MIPRLPHDPVQRVERKANLLLASAVLRGQVQRDADDVAGRADGVARRVLVVRSWLSDLLVQAAVGGGAALFAAAGQGRRRRLWGLLRWGWVAWRVWRGRSSTPR